MNTGQVAALLWRVPNIQNAFIQQGEYLEEYAGLPAQGTGGKTMCTRVYTEFRCLINHGKKFGEARLVVKEGQTKEEVLRNAINLALDLAEVRLPEAIQNLRNSAESWSTRVIPKDTREADKTAAAQKIVSTRNAIAQSIAALEKLTEFLNS